MSEASNGYEAAAHEFVARRGASRVGAAEVRGWVETLSPDAVVLDLGCGHGVPITEALIGKRREVYGVDASLSLVSALRERLPDVHVACEAVEDSRFFDRRFDGAVAWGLMFLLPAEAQAALIHDVASVLHPGGRFLFTSPADACTWVDVLTKRRSLSLGAEGYGAALTSAGLILLDEYEDEGDNHYYDAAKQAGGARVGDAS